MRLLRPYLFLVTTVWRLGLANSQNVSTDTSPLSYESPWNEHLSKRIFPFPNENTPGAYAQWMATEATTHRLRDANDPDFEDYTVDIGSTSAVHVFGREVLTASVTGLSGCTSVIVVSKRGVYISHLFEVPSFKAEKDDQGRVMTEESFDKDVKHDLIKGGTSKDPHTGKLLMTGLAGLRSLGLPFHEKTADGAENPIWIFIVTPRHHEQTAQDHGTPRPMQQPSDLEYSDKVEWIYRTMVDLFPTKKGCKIIQYERRLPQELDNPNDPRRPAYGKILFQYDPYAKDVTVPERQDENGRPCKAQAAEVRLWFMENTRPLRTNWAAELDQRTFVKQTVFPRRWLWERRQKKKADACDLKGKTFEEVGFQ